MPSTSTNQGVPVPIASDADNVPYAFSQFLGGIETRLVMRFLDASARTAAIPSPVEGMVAWLQDVDTLTIYDGSAWQPVWTATAIVDSERASVYQSSSQTFGTSGTAAAITWGATHYDTSSFWSAGNPTRLTIPRTGVYHIDTQIAWGSNATGYREIELRKNGTAVRGRDRRVPASGVTAISAVSVDLDLVAGDYLEVWATQTSGGSLGTTSGLTWSFANIRRAG